MLITKRKVKNQIEQEIRIIRDMTDWYAEVPFTDPRYEWNASNRHELSSREAALRLLAMHLEIELAV